MSRYGVVGAGPAGLIAAHRLAQAGHDVTVFESQPFVGGRTRTARFGDGHHLDTGAGWFTSAYTRALAVLDELDARDILLPMRASGPAELLVGGHRYAGPLAPREGNAEALVSDDERKRMSDWFRSLRDYPADLSYQLDHDNESATEHLRDVGTDAARYVFAPMFEGLFAPIAQQSAEFLRSWVAAGAATYWQLDGGMDTFCSRLAAGLDVRLATPVRTVTARGQIITEDTTSSFDAVVVAVPPPAGTTIVEPATQPSWYPRIAYAGQSRLYVSAPGAAPAPVHVRPIPMNGLASVEWQSGGDGAWGACPADRQWVLVCADEADNHALLTLDEPTCIERLWSQARELVGSLFDLGDADVLHLVRWAYAVPTMAPGHFTTMAAYERRAPVVFAGDWTHQACVEGAVRSGEAAAAALLG